MDTSVTQLKPWNNINLPNEVLEKIKGKAQTAKILQYKATSIPLFGITTTKS